MDKIKSIINILTEIDAKRILFGACVLLKYETQDDDLFGLFVASTTCSLCAALFAKESFDYVARYQKIKAASKKTCKAINQIAAKGEKYFKNK